jgi:hypothetical protein
MRSVLVVACLILPACGASALPGDTDAPAAPAPDDAGALDDAAAPDAGPLPAWPQLRTEGRSAVRVLVTPARTLVLEETLVGFEQPSPGPRRLRSIDRATFAERVWEPPAASRIADVAVHPSGAVSTALVDEAGHVSLVRLDAALGSAAATPLVDPQAAEDPFGGPDLEHGLEVPGQAHDAVRIAAAGEELSVAVLTLRNSVVAYRARFAGGAWVTSWRRLVEPAVGLTPFIPIGGSFDTFGAIVAWYRPTLASDGRGNAYLAVWAGQNRIQAHARHFGDGVGPVVPDPRGHSFDSDVLVTKLDASGARLWTRVAGTVFEDEPYAIAANDDGVVVVGRSRRNPGFDNSQWDPLLIALDGAGATRATRTLPFADSGIFLTVAIDAGGGLAAGGSDGWNQNPGGLSILAYGKPLLVTLAAADAAPARIALPAGPRHNEINGVALEPDGMWYAGHEDGPLTHDGDGDRARIRATGLVGVVPIDPRR